MTETVAEAAEGVPADAPADAAGVRDVQEHARKPALAVRETVLAVAKTAARQVAPEPAPIPVQAVRETAPVAVRQTVPESATTPAPEKIRRRLSRIWEKTSPSDTL